MPASFYLLCWPQECLCSSVDAFCTHWAAAQWMHVHKMRLGQKHISVVKLPPKSFHSPVHWFQAALWHTWISSVKPISLYVSAALLMGCVGYSERGRRGGGGRGVTHMGTWSQNKIKVWKCYTIGAVATAVTLRGWVVLVKLFTCSKYRHWYVATAEKWLSPPPPPPPSQ